MERLSRCTGAEFHARSVRPDKNILCIGVHSRCNKYENICNSVEACEVKKIFKLQHYMPTCETHVAVNFAFRKDISPTDDNNYSFRCGRRATIIAIMIQPKPVFTNISRRNTADILHPPISSDCRGCGRFFLCLDAPITIPATKTEEKRKR